MIYGAGKNLVMLMRSLAISSLLMMSVASSFAATANEELSAEKIRQFGEMMYRQGLLPSGEPIKAFTAGDVPVDGTAFTCVSCHLHSGLGSIEGEVITPPTNGRILYQPRKPFIKGFEYVPSFANYAKYLPERPAYTDRTLADLIASGIDPTGRSVITVMPRYEIDDENMAIMIAYLKTLAPGNSPGVTPEEIKFATVIVEGVDPARVEAMLIPLEFNIQRKNSLADASARNDRVARMAYNMLGPDLLQKRFSLSKWVLKGDPETWRSQLDAYYEKEPVFLLLGGISDAGWEPIHRFCEARHIPCIMPIVDYPVISDSDWYTLYLSRGVRQEGESAARYLRGMAELFSGREIIQLYRDNRRGNALADGFRQVLEASGRQVDAEVKLAEGMPLSAERVRNLLAEHQTAVLLIWDNAEVLKSLEGLDTAANKPDMVVLSGDWLGEKIWDVPAPLRDLVAMTYPYRLPHQEKRYDLSIQRVLEGKPMARYDFKTIRKAYASQELLGMALMEMRAEYDRDFFLDTIGMMEDQYFPLYERLSFGPGQRYASKGCYIVRLGTGESPPLEPLSEWVSP